MKLFPEASHFSPDLRNIYVMITAMRLRSASRGRENWKLPESRSERNLAVAILRQAWHEAVMDLRSVKETSRNDYRLLKRKAIEWINTDEEMQPVQSVYLWE